MDRNDYLQQVCKIGQFHACCKYLAAGAEGMICMKMKPELKQLIDDDWVKTVHVAQGDNCEGKDLTNYEDEVL